VVKGKTGGVIRRILGGCFFVTSKELSGIHHSGHHLRYFHRRPDVWPRNKACPTRAQKQIRDKFEQATVFQDVISDHSLAKLVMVIAISKVQPR